MLGGFLDCGGKNTLPCKDTEPPLSGGGEFSSGKSSLAMDLPRDCWRPC